MTELTSRYQVALTKIKGKNLEVDTSEFTDEVIHFLIGQGLDKVINSRMTKVGAVTKLTGKELEDAHKDALRIANENLDDLKAGKVKHSRGKGKSTIPAAVRAEAMLLAKRDIKDAVRAAGHKPSHYSDKAYTAKAKEYVDNDPYYIQQATQNIEARKTPSHPIQLNLADLGPTIVKKTRSTTLPAGITGKPSVATVHRDARH
jgi:hypothetical protein